jgi:membrane protease subunit (stomatin/prohibitin family)
LVLPISTSIPSRPPPEVQKAIDDKSRLGVFDDLNKLLKMKTAMAVETAAQSQSEAGAGLGMGMGVMMPGMLAEAFKGLGGGSGNLSLSGMQTGYSRKNPDFVPLAGTRYLTVNKCAHCGENLPINANFA